MPPRYKNGEIPESQLYIFNRGTTVHTLNNGTKITESWYQGLTPGSYQKHVALVALAKKSTGNNLRLSEGFSCYRPLYGQTIARILYGNGAATVGTSSHGGWWENRETMAMDYGNWSSVYGGNRNRWYADVRAVGLTPGMISPGRGYPDEPWHVIDFDPWRPVSAGGGSEPFPGGNDMGTLDNTEENYQIFAQFLFRALKWDVRDGSFGPAASNGATIWDRFGRLDNKTVSIPPLTLDATANAAIAKAVATYQVQAQDKDGKGVVDASGKPVTFDWAGYDASSNASLQSIKAQGPAAIDYDKLAAAIVALLPKGATKEEIAKTTRDLFRSDPLK